MQTIQGWIEYDYNAARAHSANAYATPIEVELNFKLAAKAMNG